MSCDNFNIILHSYHNPLSVKNGFEVAANVSWLMIVILVTNQWFVRETMLPWFLAQFACLQLKTIAVLAAGVGGASRIDFPLPSPVAASLFSLTLSRHFVGPLPLFLPFHPPPSQPLWIPCSTSAPYKQRCRVQSLLLLCISAVPV